MTSDIQFTTDSTPGEQAFERAVDSVTEAIEERFKTTGDSYGARMAGLLRMGVWISLADDGTTSVEDVHDVLTERHSGGDDDPEVRIVCRTWPHCSRRERTRTVVVMSETPIDGVGGDTSDRGDTE